MNEKLKAIQREKQKMKAFGQRKRWMQNRTRREAGGERGDHTTTTTVVTKSEDEIRFTDANRGLWRASEGTEEEPGEAQRTREELSIRLERVLVSNTGENDDVVDAEQVHDEPIVKSWDDARLPPQFHEFYTKVARLKGWTSPTPVQRQLWPLMLQGRDVAVISPTGTGKTLAFCLPAVPHILIEAAERRFQGPVVLVLAPTRELVLQISHACRKFHALFEVHVLSMIGGHGATAAGSSNRDVLENGLDTGGVVVTEEENKKKKNSKPPRPNYERPSAGTAGALPPPNLSDVDVLVCTPGRCADLVRRNDVSFKNTSILVLDEADRLFNMGFKAQIDGISAKIPRNRQTILTSATSSGEANAVAEAWLKPSHLRVLIGTLEVKVELGHRKNAPKNAKAIEAVRQEGGEREEEEEDKEASATESDVTLARHVRQTVHVCSEQKKPRNLLKHLTELRARETNSRNPAPVVVFCNRIKTVLFVYETLVKHGERAVALHGQMAQPLRERALKLFRAGKYTVLACTDVAARGLDIPSVAHVIQYDFPASLAVYAHRVGRAGRGPKWQTGGATCLSLFTRNFGCMAPDLVDMLASAGQEVGSDLREVASEALKEAGAGGADDDDEFVPNAVVVASSNGEGIDVEEEEEEEARNEDRDIVGAVPLGKKKKVSTSLRRPRAESDQDETEFSAMHWKQKRVRLNDERREEHNSDASSSSSSSSSSDDEKTAPDATRRGQKFKRPRGKRGGKRANKHR